MAARRHSADEKKSLLSHKNDNMNRTIRLRVDKTVKGGQGLRSKRCNLHCLWCHGDFFHHQRRTRGIDNHQIVEAVRKVIESSRANKAVVKISGEGEPTLVGRSELAKLVSLLKTDPLVHEVKLVTNGILLAYMIEDLAAAGLDGVNVSINSMNREIYSFITGYDGLGSAVAGAEAAWRHGLKTKINVIYTKLNHHEVDNFIKFGQERPGLIVKFFDLLITNNLCKRLYLPLEELREKIQHMASSREFTTFPYMAIEYKIPPNARVCVKIASTHNTCPNAACGFRDKCLEGCRSSIRISQDGTLHPCGVRVDNVVSLVDPAITLADIREALLSGGKGVEWV